ncbi:threonylcarbamoyl-AMP synthase [bacterium]|nr:MAG: threonylcarbamoyl-AMP synthase [bacterium]
MTLTRVIKVNPLDKTDDHIKKAAEVLVEGGLVIIPTETVYGIAANMLNEDTIARLAVIKNRPKDKPFSLHIDSLEGIEDFTREIPCLAYKLMHKFWPGPLTLILKAEGHGSIGIRMPDNEIALKIISLAGVPIVCPSANISGKPAPVNFQEAIRDLDGLVELAIDSGETRFQKESSVVDLTFEPVRILREGVIKKEQILELVAQKTVLFVCTGNTCRSVIAQALLKKRLKEKKRDDIEVASAGIMLLDGAGASQEAIEALKKEGIDVFGHRAYKLTKEMLQEADLILAMERVHEKRILDLYPEARKRLFLLKEFVKIDNGQLDIQDPLGGSAAFYGQTLAIIKQAVEKISDIL